MAALWEKLPWSKKPKKVEYRFQQSESDDSTLVEITSGEYTGVVYSYGMVKLKPESVIPILQFNYNIYHSGQHDKQALQNNDNFVTIIGDILTEIIIQNESTRTNDTEESDIQ
jgi:hypothetical protein